MAKRVIRKKPAAKKRPAAKKANVAAPRAIASKQTKSQIVQNVAEDTGLSRPQVKAVLESLSTLAKRHVMPRGSGEFAVPDLGVKIRRVRRKARLARNPQTGEPVHVPARTAIKASILKTLKDAVA